MRMLPCRLSCFLNAGVSTMVNMSTVYKDLHTLQLSSLTQVDEDPQMRTLVALQQVVANQSQMS